METTKDESFASISTIDLTKEELHQEYSNLKKACTLSQSDVDNKNQQIYDLKRQLDLAHALEKEYQQEIEALQSEDKIQSKKLEVTIAGLEENIRRLTIDHENQLRLLIGDIANKDVQISALERDIGLASKSSSDCNTEEFEKIANENAKLKSQIFDLKEYVLEVEAKVESGEKHQMEVQEILLQLKEDYKNLQQNYEQKRNELYEKSNMIETLQEDLLLAKNELDLIKSKPLDQESRGNSLFAEVNDKRVELKNRVETMSVKYKQMKQEKAKFTNEIFQLRNENTELCQKLKDEVEGKQQDIQLVLRSHNLRIKTLETLIENYQKEIKSNPLRFEGLHFVGDQLKFVENMLDKRSKEIEVIRNDISNRSLSHMMLTAQLRDTNRELRTWRLTSTQQKHEIEMLKSQIESLKEGKKVEEEAQPSVKELDTFKLPLDIAEALRLKRSLVNTQKRSGSFKRCSDKHMLDRNVANQNPLEKHTLDTLKVFDELNDKENVEGKEYEVDKQDPEDTGHAWDKENADDTLNAEDKPANQAPGKKVTFTGVEENSRPPGTKMRRAAKVIVCKPKYFPSKKPTK